jgi:ATP-dependent DNA helicase RecQ
MVDYAYARHCLRRFILGYFGERVTFHECHNCSHCLEHGKTLQARILTEEETVIVKKVLSCVARMKGRYGRMRVAQVLTGANIDALAYLRLNRLSTFGILQELSQPEVLSVIDALVESNLLQIEGAEYPLIQLPAQGVDAMLGRIPISMDFPIRLKKRQHGETARRKTSRSRSPSAAASVRHHFEEAAADDSALPYHEELFEALRRMRRQIASSAGLAPFIIFHDETLKSISRRLPQTVEELRAVKGVGEHKIASYGVQTLDVVKDFLKNHPMVLPISSPSSQGRNR